MLIIEIKKDLERAKKALSSAERNFQEEDILTAANRNFVACENSIYVLLKLAFGSISVSRQRILALSHFLVVLVSGRVVRMWKRRLS